MYTLLVRFPNSYRLYHYASKFYYGTGSNIEVHTPEGYKSVQVFGCHVGISRRCTKFKSGNIVTPVHWKAYPCKLDAPQPQKTSTGSETDSEEDEYKKDQFIDHVNDAVQSLRAAQALCKVKDVRLGLTQAGNLCFQGTGVGSLTLSDGRLVNTPTTSYDENNQKWVEALANHLVVESEEQRKKQELEQQMKELLDKAKQIESQIKLL